MVLQLQPDLPVLGADPEKLARVVANLLDNALRYSDDGSPVVIETGVSAGFVRISIHDQGQGFSPNEIATLFDRYNRAGKTAGTGLDLGLFIVRLLTEAHGGHLFVCSRPEEGSTFSAYFPT